MTVTEVSEHQIQRTCPDFCERTHHENWGTPDSPAVVHSTEDHDVHGVLIRIANATDGEGVELGDSAPCVSIDEREKSLQEAWDIGSAILTAVTQAELSIPRVKAVIENNRGNPTASLPLCKVIRAANQEKHDRLRATRSEKS